MFTFIQLKDKIVSYFHHEIYQSYKWMNSNIIVI